MVGFAASGEITATIVFATLTTCSVVLLVGQRILDRLDKS